jgi:murein DD-endopeptidase MepM/ murein hydrolase activator NlpD
VFARAMDTSPVGKTKQIVCAAFAAFAFFAAEARLAASELHISAQSRAMQPGELVVLTIAAPASTSVRVRAFDRDIAPIARSDHTWTALVGIDLDAKPGTHRVVVDSNDGEHAVYELAVKPRRFPTRRLTVNPDFVTPPASEQARIEREAALLHEVYNATASEALWHAPFVRPVPQAANSAFGTRSVFNGLPRNAHGGADFLSPAGERVHAPNAGRVVVAQNLYFSGNTVIIDHGLGLFSTLAHLSAFDVREGDHVTAGQLVGRVGATGRVTGPHLHWAVRVAGARIDPLSLLAMLGQDGAKPTNIDQPTSRHAAPKPRSARQRSR